MTWCRPLYVHRKFATLIKKYVIYSNIMNGIKRISKFRKLTKKMLKLSYWGPTVRARLNLFKLTKKIMQKQVDEKYKLILSRWALFITKITLYSDIKAGLGNFDINECWFKLANHLMT